MKRVLFSLVMFAAVSAVFAQTDPKAVKAAVSAAKSAANSGKFAEAEKTIEAAMNNAATKDDASVWDAAGYVQQKISMKESENQVLKKAFDTIQVYKSALKMVEYFSKCDELAQLPDAKGKVNNKYRKKNAVILIGERNNLINGGIYYFNAQNYAEAFKYLAAYADLKDMPLTAKEPAILADSTITQMAYYACSAAYRMEDYKNCAKYAKQAFDDKEFGEPAMEFYCISLKELGQTDEWLAALKKGVATYPGIPYFFANLVEYFSSNSKYDEAIAYADDMLKNDPNNALYLFCKGYIYQQTKEYDKALEFYAKATNDEKSDYCAQSYSNMGLIYCIQAQDFSATATTDVNAPKYKEEQIQLKSYYEKAKPCYEKARQLKPDQKDLWLQGLYRVYYNLDMGNEFKEIEAMM